MNMTPSATKAEKILIIACGALAREILAVIEQGALSHVTLTCIDAKYHNHPELIAPAVETKIMAERDNYDRILIGYADCGTAGELDKVIDTYGLERLEGAHCYAFFTGVQKFEAESADNFTAFYLTDFLARQFDALVYKPLGLDRHPELRDMYFQHYTEVVYLAQTDDPALDKAAQEAAERLGLSYRREKTGYGDLETTIKSFSQAPQSSHQTA